MSNHDNSGGLDERLRELLDQHGSPEALAAAEAATEVRLAEAAAEHEEFLRGSHAYAPFKRFR